MALTFPLPRADWWDGLRIQRLTVSLRETANVAQTVDGAVLVQTIGLPLWEFEVALTPILLPQAREVRAMLRAIKRPGASALVGPVEERVPALDPTGSVSSASVTISSISTDLLAVAFTGLPAGYTLAAGDWWSVQVNGVWWLHQLSEGGAADGAGTTAELATRPAVSPALTSGAAVTLVDPVCEAVIDPASIDEGTAERVFVKGIGWRMIQVLR